VCYLKGIVSLYFRCPARTVGFSGKVCFRETHSPSRTSEIYGHNAFRITHLHTAVINSGHTTQLNTAHTMGLCCGASLSADCGYNPG